MNKPFHAACRRAGRGVRIAVSFFIGLAGVPLAAQAATPAADNLVDACASYQNYVAIGGEGSGTARAFGRVCDRIGPVAITQQCLVYYTRITDTAFPPDKSFKAQLTSECEASMPGGTALAKKKVAEARKPVRIVGPQRMYGPPMDAIACGANPDCAATQEDPAAEAPDEPGASAADEATRAQSAEPVSIDERAGTKADAAPASAAADSADTPAEATRAAETSDAPSDMPEMTPEEMERAIELAFWEAVVDSTDPALFEAYIARFPEGVFVPVARTRIAALTEEKDEPEPAIVAPVEDPVAQPVEVPQSPEDKYTLARSMLDLAYQRNASEWAEAIAPAIPLLEESGRGGYGPAYVELGGLAENGLGMAEDLDRALRYYRLAGRAGAFEGYYRALMLYDRMGAKQGYVDAFLSLYRADPDLARESLGDVGSVGPTALQRYLKDKGYYRGALDGDFGPASMTALDMYVRGDKPPPVETRPPKKTTPELPPADGLAVQVQQALAQANCYFGPVDGRWGPSSAEAMTRFNRWYGVRFPTSRPSVEALAALARTPGPVCRAN